MYHVLTLGSKIHLQEMMSQNVTGEGRPAMQVHMMRKSIMEFSLRKNLMQVHMMRKSIKEFSMRKNLMKSLSALMEYALRRQQLKDALMEYALMEVPLWKMNLMLM